HAPPPARRRRPAALGVDRSAAPLAPRRPSGGRAHRRRAPGRGGPGAGRPLRHPAGPPLPGVAGGPARALLRPPFLSAEPLPPGLAPLELAPGPPVARPGRPRLAAVPARRPPGGSLPPGGGARPR